MIVDADASYKQLGLSGSRPTLTYRARSAMAILREAWIVLTAPLLSRNARAERHDLLVHGAAGMCNPSIARWQGAWVITARTTNYVKEADGTYVVEGGPHRLNSESWMLTCNDDFAVVDAGKIDTSAVRAALPSAANGLEDPRLLPLGDRMLCMWSAANLNAEPDPAHEEAKEVRCRPDWSRVSNVMVLGEIAGARVMEPLEMPSPHGFAREKNWVPCVDSTDIYFVYSLYAMEVYRLQDGALSLAYKAPSPYPALSGCSGSSQLIAWEGGWLCVVHRVLRKAGKLLRGSGSFYAHQLVFIGRDWSVRSVSRDFFLEKKGIEFCAGAAVYDGRLAISYGVDDARAAILSVDLSLVRDMLKMDL